MRAALGAGRLRLLRQMLTESIALSCCGAVLGLALAVAGTRVVAHLNAFNLPLLNSVHIDGNVLAFTLLAAVFTGVLFGVLPALQAPALAVQDALKEGGRGLSAGKKRAWLRNGLVVSEIAFASVLLVGAGLLVRSFVSVLTSSLGFEPEHTAVLRVDPGTRISNLAQQNAFLDDMLQRARSIPGRPVGGSERRFAVRRRPVLAGGRKGTSLSEGPISSRTLHSSGQRRILRGCRHPLRGRQRIHGAGSRIERTGRDREPDIGPHSFGQDKNPIGQVMTQDGGREVIGVVADIRHEALEKTGGSEMYIPLRQTGDYSDDGTGGAHDAAAGGIRSGNSSGAASAGSKSADPRGPKPAGFRWTKRCLRADFW